MKSEWAEILLILFIVMFLGILNNFIEDQGIEGGKATIIFGALSILIFIIIIFSFFTNGRSNKNH